MLLSGTGGGGGVLMHVREMAGERPGGGGASTESIEELLRARAVASILPRSVIPSAATKPKSPTSLEEGEISSAEDTELPTCSAIAPDDNRPPFEPIVTTLMSKPAKVLTTNIPVNQLRKANKRKRAPKFNAKSARAKSHIMTNLGWARKLSDNDLVITFSDDDSGADSDDSNMRKTSDRDDLKVMVENSKMPTVDSRISTALLHLQSMEPGNSSNDRFKPPYKESASFASIESRAQICSSGGNNVNSSTVEKDLLTHKNSSTITIPKILEDEHASAAALVDGKVESLRNQIAVCENELNIQLKSMLPNNGAISRLSTDGHVSNLMNQGSQFANTISVSCNSGGLLAEEQTLKRQKLDKNSNRQATFCRQTKQIFFPISNYENKKKAVERSEHQLKENIERMEGKKSDIQHQEVKRVSPMPSAALASGSKCDGSLASYPVTIPSKICNQFSSQLEKKKVSCSNDQSSAMAIFPSAMTILPGSTSPTKTTYIEHTNSGGYGHLHVSNMNESSTLFPTKAPPQQDVSRIQQSVIDISSSGMPFEGPPDNVQNSPALVNILATDEMYSRIASLFNCSSLTDTTSDRNLQLQALEKFEEMHDKELEEAQQLRLRCELEETRALKVYREAQKALILANDRCSHLYKKREISAKLRAFALLSSSSLSDNRQNFDGSISDFVKPLPAVNLDTSLSSGHEMSDGCDKLKKIGYESNCHCDDLIGLSDTQMNERECVPDQFEKHNSGILKPMAGNALSYADRSVPLNMSPEDGEENVMCGLSRITGDVSVGNQGTEKLTVPHNNVQNCELLEANLRSQLVARLGKKMRSKHNDMYDPICISDKSTNMNKNTNAFDSQDSEVVAKGMFNSKGFESTKPRDHMFQQPVSHFHGKDLVCSSDPRMKDEHQEDELCEISVPVLSLPSSTMQVVSRHATSILSWICDSVSLSKPELRFDTSCEVDNFQDCSRVTNDHLEESIRKINSDNHLSVVEIDLFWPFCIYELRGKCNNEECPWQHAHNLKSKRGPRHANSDGQVNMLLTHGGSSSIAPYIDMNKKSLSIPCYGIGQYVMKSNSSCVSRFVLARSIWLYWQLGFSASLPSPIAVQRILPLDAPTLLQFGDSHIENDGSWSRPSLSFQKQDAPLEQIMHGQGDSEQCLEFALDFLYGKPYRSDRKKVLILLSRAIETNPGSVVLWIVYLHVYYIKETCTGKDDMFFYAVQYNRDSYDLWLLYVNSRMRLSDRLLAYEKALATLSNSADNFDMENRHRSACILDMFLQMVDFLCMCGEVDQAIQKVYGLIRATDLMEDDLLSEVYSRLVDFDRSLFWLCCIYLIVYRKLPGEIVQQFELEKELPFGMEWPCAQVTSDVKQAAIEMMEFAVARLISDDDGESPVKDRTNLRSLHFLAVCHVRCAAAFGLDCFDDLLAKYRKLFPSCVELVLVSGRLQGNGTAFVRLGGFEEAVSNWPLNSPGLQRVWNQFAELVSNDRRYDFSEKIMDHWAKTFPEPLGDLTENSEDQTFWFFNLSVLRLLQNNLMEARSAVDSALKLAAPEDFKHCVTEHAALAVSCQANSEIKVRGGLIGLLKGYYADSRSSFVPKPLSGRYCQSIKKPRTRLLLDKILGPVSKDSSIMNSALEACYGPSLLPDNFDTARTFVDLLELLMELTPANFQLVLCAYKLIKGKLGSIGGAAASDSLLFWISSLLVNSVLQAVPAAPETTWLEVAHLLRDLKRQDIAHWFHSVAVSVYPFSRRLWQSYLELSKKTGKPDDVIGDARDRGFELNEKPG